MGVLSTSMDSPSIGAGFSTEDGGNTTMVLRIVGAALREAVADTVEDEDCISEMALPVVAICG
jgi:hypothetical protein